MSADNYVLVAHDGDNFLVYHGFMSCIGEEYDDDTVYEPALVATVATEGEVEDIIDNYAIIEGGVQWTAEARAACGGGDEKLEKAIESLANKVVNLAAKLEEHMNEADAHNCAMMGKK